MSDVEELCERVALIDEGRLLLLGELAEIKRQRGANSVQDRLGHANAAFTLNRCGHVAAGLQEQAADAFARLMTGATG